MISVELHIIFCRELINQSIKAIHNTGIPKCEIKNITEHTSAQGLDDYDSGDEREQQMISNIIDNSSPATSRGVLSQLYPARSSAFPSSAPGHVYNFNLQLQRHVEHCR